MEKGRNKLLEFLLDKQSKGLEMNLGEAMFELNIWSEDGFMDIFRDDWEENNLKK